jgi:hypothetical protein
LTLADTRAIQHGAAGLSPVPLDLIAGQIEEMHLAVAPVLLGEGKHLFSGINLAEYWIHTLADRPR